MPVTIHNLKPFSGKALLAVFDVELPSGVVLRQCILKYRDIFDDFTIIPPRIPAFASDGAVCRDRTGRIKYESAISFKTLSVRDHFVKTVLDALREQAPQVFTKP